MKINISGLNIQYNNGVLDIIILDKNGIQYGRTQLGTINSIKDFDNAILKFLHGFITED